ncbi:carbohydrate binding domain-containing protein [Paenibacillaceae bacterium WGS1546]|uniref:alpha-amylase family glycosyl hydrolase n=1 Tax=Cohnella sp. WGS1546 TaxID=3366810 RepID=UPI00372D751F
MKLFRKTAGWPLALLMIVSLLTAIPALAMAGEPANSAVRTDRLISSDPAASADTFSWDNATVYFVLTDRFLDGDPSNNHSYGRELDQHGNPYPGYKSKVGTFHGGDLKGLTDKIQDGYFNDLGVNAIWITAPYEQIHGWVGGENFRHYAYHGYYALDFTEIDRNMGTEEDFRTFVDTAHEHGIRIVMDVVLNHAGYETMKDMGEFNFGQLNTGWENYYYNQPESSAHYTTYNGFVANTDPGRWANWWGPDWIRTKYAGYSPCGGSDTLLCLSDLPDFKTESTNEVSLPPLLLNKWDSAKRAREIAELDDFFNRTGKPRTVANHLIKWVTDWVRDYGIDGFRVDTVKHVDASVWNSLKEEAVIALRDWKAANPHKKLDDLDFWMTGEVWGHGVGRSHYFDNGFDSIINFSFQGSAGNLSSLEGLFSSYAASINSDPTFNVLSYISSHDTSLYNRGNLIRAGTSLLLLPGAVQIFYGDETGRQPDNSWPWDQPTRTDMNWNSIDRNVLSHWQKLGQFRNKHVSIGAGEHKQLQASPYAFSRTYHKNGIEDAVVVAVGASGSTAIDVGSVFPDGTLLKDAYTGATAVVAGGRVTFAAHANGVILIEEIPSPNARVSASPAGGSFSSDTTTVRLFVRNADFGYYTLDGSDPRTNGIEYVNGDQVTIGEGMQAGDTVALRLYAENEHGTAEHRYAFTKTDGLTIHFKKPSNWGPPQLYYYDTTPIVPAPTWGTSPPMIDEGNGWYVYTIDDVDSAHVIFKDSGGRQIPGVNAPGYLVAQESWYDNGWVDHPFDTTPPTAPTDLSVSAKTDNSVSLTWTASTDNVGVAGYEIYRDGGKVGESAVASYTDNGLSPDTEYTYTVRAFDAARNYSEASDALTVATEPLPPTNTATIYYKKGFAAPYFHYAPAGGAWTTVPGIRMTDSADYPGYAVIAVDIGQATSLQAVFNNGSGSWDNNGGRNYVFQQGTWTFDGGTITQGEPQLLDLTVRVNVPATTTTEDPVYIVGSFNGWNPADSSYRLSRNNDGTYSITLRAISGTTLEFKFTRGSWSSVEANANNTDTANRSYTMQGTSQTTNQTVIKWKDK